MTNLTKAIIAVALLSFALPIHPVSKEASVQETAKLEKPVVKKRRVRIIE